MISPHAIVESDAVADDAVVHPFAVIRAGARVGSGSVIHPHAVIAEGVEIGNGVEVHPGAHLGKIPKGAGNLARVPDYRPVLRIGDECQIGPHVVLYYDVEIGPRTLVGDGSSVREGARIGERCVIGRNVTLHYNVRIGDRTRVLDLSHVTGDCVIGDDVFISVQVSMANDNALGREGYDADAVLGPVIEDGVSIGAGAVLIPRTRASGGDSPDLPGGLHVGRGAIVSAGAVVARDVEAATLVMGSPARVVKRLEPVD